MKFWKVTICHKVVTEYIQPFEPGREENKLARFRFECSIVPLHRQPLVMPLEDIQGIQLQHLLVHALHSSNQR